MSLWNKFKYIHSDNIPDAFEKMVLALYSHIYNLPSMNSFKNQAYIEQYPIIDIDGNYVGLQAKCVDKLSDVSTKIKCDIPKIASYEGEMKVDKLIYFFSFDISQDSKTLKNSYWEDIVKLGKQNGLQIEYWGISKILREIEDPHNQHIYEKFFAFENLEKEVTQYKVSEGWKEHYIERKIVFNGSERRIDDILDDKGIVFLIGDAGLGKSTEIDKICTLYNLKGYNTFKLNLSEYYGENLSSIGITTSSLKSGKSLYLFDGYDDLDIKYVNAFRGVINRLRLNSQIKVIIAGRTIHYYDSEFHNEIPIITLKLLSDSDIDNYLTERLNEDVFNFKLLAEKVDMSSYLRVPFYLVKLVDIYISRRFVPSIAKMFEILFDIDIKKKSFDSNHDIQLVMNDLMDLAEDMIINGRVSCLISDVKFVTKEKSLKSGWLTIDETSRSIKFVHKTFSEYLFARKLLESSITELVNMVTVSIQDEIYLIPKFSNIVRILSEFSNEFAYNLEAIGYKGMINYETSKVPSDKRIKNFMSIVQKNIEFDYWYNEQRYSYDYLASLMDSDQGTIILLDLLKNNDSNVVLHIVTNTLVYNAKKYNDIVVKKLLDYIKTIKDSNKLNEILKILSNCDLKKEELSQIMEKWFDKANSTLRATFYHVIEKNSWEDYFLRFLLKGKKVDSNHFGRKQGDDIYNISEGVNLSRCFSNLKNIESILTLGNYILSTTKKRHNDFISELEKHYISKVEEIKNFDDNIRTQFLKFIELRLSDIYIRDYSDLTSIINLNELLNDTFEILKESDIYDFRKIQLLAQISSLENIGKVVKYILTNQALYKFDQVFLNQLERYKKIKEYEFASSIITPVETPETREDTTIQEHFNNLFIVDFLNDELKKIFKHFNNSFTWEKLMTDYENDFDYDIKILFHSFKDSEKITCDSIENWDIEWTTFNLILHKASEQDLTLSNEQIVYISDEVSKKYTSLNCTGVSKQHKSGYSLNIYTGQLSKIAYKYDINFPVEFYKLLNYHVTTIDHSFVGIDYLEKYLDLNLLLDINVELINEDFFTFETELTKRIDFLGRNNDFRIKDKLLQLIVEEPSDEVALAIIKFFKSHNRLQLLDDYMEYLSNDSLKFYFRDISKLDESRYRKIKAFFENIDDYDDRKFTLSSILLIRKNIEDYKLFLDLCYKVKQILLSGYEAVNYIKYIDDISILSDLLILAISLKKDDFDHTPNIVLTQIENYFVKYNTIGQAGEMNSELDILVKALIGSDVELTNRYLAYIEKLIVGYLNNIV